MTGSKSNRLQDAVDDSGKDPIRHAASLNALKQRFLERKEDHDAKAIERFQNLADNPYRFRSGAVLICTNDVFDEAALKTVKITGHPNSANLTLVVVKGAALMQLVHALYERAANEA